MKKHAYVIPYTIEQGEIKVAIAKKEKFSYQAILEWSKTILAMNCNGLGCNEKELGNLKQDILKLGSDSVITPSIINKDGRVRGLDRRFNGMLLPAGGKATFFGGDMSESDEGNYKKTAIREFIEEFNLVAMLSINKKTISAELGNNLHEIWHCKENNFIYFSLDFDKFIVGLGVEGNLFTVCRDFNKWVTRFHNDLAALAPPGSPLSRKQVSWLKDKEKHNNERGILFPELREIALYPISSDDTTHLFADNGKNDIDYIEEKIKQFVPYFCESLGCQTNLSEECIKKYEEGLIQHLLNHAKIFEKIDWHQMALQKFQREMCANMPPTRSASPKGTSMTIFLQHKNQSKASCSFLPS